jgi:hypothetical protein
MHTMLKAAAFALGTLALGGTGAAQQNRSAQQGQAAAPAQNAPQPPRGRPAPPPYSPAPVITASLDIGGSGNFTGVIDGGQLCYLLNAAGIAQPTAAHIHSGKAGEAGPAVVTLATPTDGASGACMPIAADLAKKLVADAPDYYLDIHSATYPQGEVRAQLAGHPAVA